MSVTDRTVLKGRKRKMYNKIRGYQRRGRSEGEASTRRKERRDNKRGEMRSRKRGRSRDPLWGGNKRLDGSGRSK